MSRLTVFIVLLTVANVATMVELVRRRRLKEKYALLWLGVAAAGIVLALARGLIDAAARLIGVSYGPTLLFIGAILFLLLVCVQLSVELSRLEERVVLLAQELALRDAQDAPPGAEE